MKRVITLLTIMAVMAISPGCKKKDEGVTVARKGYVNFLSGDVKLISQKSGEATAKIGDEVAEGMKIKTTGDKSFVDIYFGENVIKVLGNTIIEVKKLVTKVSDNSEESLVYVEKGNMFTKITKKLAKNDKFEVKTPTTTAGVRGTQFLVKEKDGKANIACLEGMLAVLNNSLKDAEPTMVATEKECDVESGKPIMVKELSDENKRLIQDIVSNIQALREDIWNQMRQQREEIRQYVIDQREKDKNLVQEQKDKDKANVEDQKARDRENIENIKGSTKDKADEATQSAKDKMDAAKDVNKNAAKDAAKDQMSNMKPTIEKKKINMDMFKKK